MKYYNFDTIYVNGSSLTAGGGLDQPNVKKEYKRLYDIEWDDEKQVTYPKYISDYFECELVHDAVSGAGAPRLIRRTYEYIEKIGIKKAQKTLFLFEITSPVHRVDQYYEVIGDYAITNVRYDDERNLGGLSSIQIHSTTTKDGIKYPYTFFDGKITEETKDYLQKYHNPIAYVEKHKGLMVGLFSFLEKHNIEFFYWFDDDSIKPPYGFYYESLDKKRDLKFETYNSVNQFCGFNNHTIKDEVPGITDDKHPGYFGNKLFSERVIKMLENRLKPRLFAFGDSHTKTFKSHQQAGTVWAKTYFDYIGEVPKTYSEIISRTYDIELFNYGIGGCSNYTIFEQFMNNYKSIKPNDIVVFGWTAINRFKLANNVNSFVDILPNTPHPKQNDDVDLSSTQQIAINRDTHSVWWSEINQFMDVIKSLLPKNKVYHWTWVSPEVVVSNNIWSQESIEAKHTLFLPNWRDTDENTKNLIRSNCDYLVDLKNDVDLNEMKNLAEQGKKLIVVNIEYTTSERQEFVHKNFNIKHYGSFNYKKQCFDRMIPRQEYSLIVDETNGAVPDRHTGKIGHIQLAQQLMDLIEDKKPTLI
ncbi:hypothetical protein [Flavobacterium sp.]|uniref:hypothetical protein n=1 Tax=Flavobacterium sp. TaxID=239 RepID=UPI0038D16DB2